MKYIKSFRTLLAASLLTLSSMATRAAMNELNFRESETVGIFSRGADERFVIFGFLPNGRVKVRPEDSPDKAPDTVDGRELIKLSGSHDVFTVGSTIEELEQRFDINNQALPPEKFGYNLKSFTLSGLIENSNGQVAYLKIGPSNNWEVTSGANFLRPNSWRDTIIYLNPHQLWPDSESGVSVMKIAGMNEGSTVAKLLDRYSGSEKIHATQHGFYIRLPTPPNSHLPLFPQGNLTVAYYSWGADHPRTVEIIDPETKAPIRATVVGKARDLFLL
jgi:hypothetical protein